MAMSSATLASELQNLTPRIDEPGAAEALAEAYRVFALDAVGNGAPEVCVNALPLDVEAPTARAFSFAMKSANPVRDQAMFAVEPTNLALLLAERHAAAAKEQDQRFRRIGEHVQRDACVFARRAVEHRAYESRLERRQ